MTRLRLAGVNCHHGVGTDGRHDLPRLARVLAGLAADVLCLQEVDRHFGSRSGGVDQARLLADALGLALVWGPAIDQPGADGGPRRQYGNALLTGLPVLAEEVHRLPGGGEPRSAVRAVLGLGSGSVQVTVTHLSTGEPARRATQVAALAALPAPSPAVLAGDLNCRPDAPELAPLRARHRDSWPAAAVRADRSGWRVWARGAGATFPARRPRARIDQVWVTPDVGVAAARVADGRGASDHLPLVVDLDLP